MLACDRLHLSQFRQIARRTDHGDRFVVLEHWLNGYKQRPVDSDGRKLDSYAATIGDRLFNNASFFICGSQDVTAFATKQEARVHCFHRSSGTINSLQCPDLIED